MTTTRRTFVSWLSGLGAALGLGVRIRVGEARPALAPLQQTALDESATRGVAEAVLPSELGNDGFTRISRNFIQWISGYRPGVELVHPYGSTQLRQTGASPAARWGSQLVTLDRESRAKHQQPFVALSREQRRALIQEAIAGDRLNRLPDPLEANHVAMALLSWYFATPEAADLCYNARIGRQQCRPLVDASRQPLPLRDGGRGNNPR